MHAFLYLRAEPGRLDDVVIHLHGVHGVRQAVAVVGDWDAMAILEGHDFASIARSVVKEVHAIEGVTRTMTAPIVPLGRGAAPPLPMQQPGPACYVHIDVGAGGTVGVVEALAEIDAVRGVAIIAGRHDVVAEIPTSWEAASPIVLEVIQAIPGVIRTSTVVALPGIEAEAGEP